MRAATIHFLWAQFVWDSAGKTLQNNLQGSVKSYQT